jgi:hypothetical protein
MVKSEFVFFSLNIFSPSVKLVPYAIKFFLVHSLITNLERLLIATFYTLV